MGMQVARAALLTHARGALSAGHAVPAGDIAGRVQRAGAWADALAAICRRQVVHLLAAAGRVAEVVSSQAARPTPGAGVQGVPAAPGRRVASQSRLCICTGARL